MLRVCRLASHKNNLITSDFEEFVVIIIKATKISSLFYLSSLVSRLSSIYSPLPTS